MFERRFDTLRAQIERGIPLGVQVDPACRRSRRGKGGGSWNRRGAGSIGQGSESIGQASEVEWSRIAN